VTAADEPYELVLTPPAVRALQMRLTEPVAAAVIEFLTGALVENPRRAGKQLRADLAGIYSARRGTYRVLYRINEARREVVVVRIDHRRSAYRTT
jgi:mRNA interferase RelE/StbE